MSAPIDSDLMASLATLAGTGLLVGLGKLLISEEKLTARLMIGRTMISSALSVAAGSIMVFIPGVPMLGVIGLASACAVLGEQFLERWIREKLHVGP